MIKKQILILCTGNSCRSQMAEAYIRYFAGNKAEVYSAGVEIHGLNAKAVASMKEDGMDISAHTSNHVDVYAHIRFDMIITVCDHAREQCPYFPSSAQKFHQDFPDPAKAKGTKAEIMAQFREVRASIKAYCEQWVKENL